MCLWTNRFVETLELRRRTPRYIAWLHFRPGGNPRFQTRCLLCLDLKQWGRYPVQHVHEGSNLVTPKLNG